MKNTIYLNKELQNDNVYGEVKAVKTTELLGMPVVNKMAQTIISNGKAVATCSNSYGLLENNSFFGKMEHELIDESINYKTRSFNHDDARFYVDYILDDESKVITVNQAQTGIDDTIVPMIRLTNSYDGSMKTAGYLGFFRKVCNNGLHMAHTQIEFSVKHTKGNMDVFIPRIDELVKRFLDNELYSITDKIQKMKTHFIDEKQLYQWIEDLSKQEKLFIFEKSKENPAPSLNAEIVHDIVLRDAVATNVEPNAWLLYSAFNELVHGKMKKSFVDQKKADTAIFNNITELVGAN